MSETIGKLLTFLGQHADLIELVARAIDSGTTKEAITEAIKVAMTKASDEQMRRELGP